MRPDGLQSTTLLTYAYYAPWVQVTQICAAKQAAYEIRSAVRKHREGSEAAQQVGVVRKRIESRSPLVLYSPQ